MEKGQKTIKYFLVALAIIVATAAFLRLSYEARAVETLSIEQASSSIPVLYNNFYVGQEFIAVDSSISSVALAIYNDIPFTATSSIWWLKICSGALSNHATSSNTSCTYYGNEKEYDNTNATTTLVDSFWKITFDNSLQTFPGQPYFLMFHYAGLVGSGFYVSGTSTYANGDLVWVEPPTGQDLAFRIYTDGTLGEEGQTDVVVLDGETFFDDGLSYKFEKEKYCMLEHPETDCEVKYWYSKKALFQQLYVYYADENGSVISDYGLAASATPSNTWSYQDYLTLENPAAYFSATTSGWQRYCTYAVATTSLLTWQNCTGLKVLWITDDDYDQLVEEMTASTTVAQMKADCQSCSETGSFACSIMQSGCELFIPSVDAQMRIYDLKKKTQDGFPLNIYYDFKDTFAELAASSSASSSAILAASTTGIYLYWNGVKLSNAPILSPKVLHDGLEQVGLLTFLNDWLGYFIYLILGIYLLKRLFKISGSDAFTGNDGSTKTSIETTRDIHGNNNITVRGSKRL